MGCRLGHVPYPPSYECCSKSRFLTAESRRFGMTALAGPKTAWESLGLGEWGFLPSIGMTRVIGGGKTSPAICDYAVGKVPGAIEQTLAVELPWLPCAAGSPTSAPTRPFGVIPFGTSFLQDTELFVPLSSQLFPFDRFSNL